MLDRPPPTASLTSKRGPRSPPRGVALRSGVVPNPQVMVEVFPRKQPRTLKGPLELRPVHHRLEDRVRAHVFLCMLAYYLAWHLREAWAELLFKDECPPTQPEQLTQPSATQARALELVDTHQLDG
jgi:hypothetical protein